MRLDERMSLSRNGSYSMGDMTYQALLERIISGHYQANSKLPPEIDLATELGVSRPVLREALQRLKSDGVLASRQGSGNFVIRQPHPTVLHFASLSRVRDIQDCFKFRVSVEGEAAFHAAEAHDPQTLQEIRSAFAALQRAVESRELGVALDFNFHFAVACATGNAYFSSTLEAMKEEIIYSITLTRQLSLRRSLPRLLLVQNEHRAIMQAIEERRPDEARRCMREHLEAARRRVFEGDLEQSQFRDPQETAS